MISRSTFEAADRIDRQGELGRPTPIFSPRELECVVLVVQDWGGTPRRLSAGDTIFFPAGARELYVRLQRAARIACTHGNRVDLSPPASAPT